MNNNINSLSIKNYKNLKDFKVDSLSRVNLVVGKNNSGKSTLLEAISIYATRGNAEQIKKILNMRGLDLMPYRPDVRGYDEKNIEILSTLYSDTAKNMFFLEPIELEANKNKKSKIEIRLVRMIREQTIDKRGNRLLKIRKLEEDEGFLPDSDIFEQLHVESEEKSRFSHNYINPIITNLSIIEKTPTEYVKTSDVSSDDNPTYFDKIALSELEKELVNALNILDPRISAINFLNEENPTSPIKKRVPVVTLNGDDRRHRLSSMGDGTNRILTIILAMLNCKDGIFLIDEFDNGLHYSVQTKLWEMVYRLAEKLNIQVFATTHSNDCIKSFIDAGKEQKETPSLIRLEKREDNVVAVSYNKESLLRYILTSDAEVR